MNWLKGQSYWIVAGIVFLPVMAQSQTRMGSVTVRAKVSETVALSVSPNLPYGNLEIEPQSEIRALRLTLSGAGPDVVTVRVPILIRSNIGWVITTQVQSQAVTAANFAVLDARPTGRFVAPNAIASLKVAPALDRPTATEPIQIAPSPVNPLAILSGPRVSLAGTLNSADNALEVTLLITVKPDAGAGHWLLHLTLSGSAGF